MTGILDCVVSYFGPQDDGEDVPRRYCSYHVIGAPGPSEGAGVAAITTLAASDGGGPCATCQTFHAVATGGPAAAVAKALDYLDAWHEGDRLRRVQSTLRGAASAGRDGTTPRVTTPRVSSRGGTAIRR
jgi:hypothetical protein